MSLRRLAKGLLMRSSAARFLCYRYRYSFSPGQLCFLASCVERTAPIPGPIVEVGCFAGCTTVWLNRHMDEMGIEKPYVAIDTFSGFTPSDIADESGRGGAAPDVLRSAFSVNDKAWFDKTMALNGVRRVVAYEADANSFDFSPFTNLSFVLIDVDLYKPVMRVLEAVHGRMGPGGIIVVDDCAAGQMYEGALQAYREFIRAKGVPEMIVHEKLGLIQIPA